MTPLQHDKTSIHAQDKKKGIHPNHIINYAYRSSLHKLDNSQQGIRTFEYLEVIMTIVMDLQAPTPDWNTTFVIRSVRQLSLNSITRSNPRAVRSLACHQNMCVCQEQRVEAIAVYIQPI
jgi:hypothetical protein